MTVTVKDNWILIPDEWAQEIGLEQGVELVRIPQGLLIKSIAGSPRKPTATWDDVFSSKLTVRRMPAEAEGELELTGDEYFL